MSSFLKTKTEYDCSGCGACKVSCPQRCIEMVEHEDGFSFPSVNAENCISCHLCEKVCPYETALDRNIPLETIAAVAGDHEIVAQSSSGGLFSEIADAVLKMGGVVYGATLDETFQCVHVRVNNEKDLYKLQKSKYVQSRAYPVYAEIIDLLQQNRTVLFSGTPCQVAGLKNLTNGKDTTLYTIDIACHGVPSQKAFDQYVRYLEKKHRGRLQTIDFRYKRPGQWGHNLSYDIDRDGMHHYEYKPYQSAYYFLFLHGKTFRKSCYQCPYAAVERVGDITLADCWGLEQNDVPFDISDGISALTINTERGRELMNLIREKVNTHPVSLNMIKEFNQPFREPCREPEGGNELVKKILSDGYSESKNYMSKITYLKEMIKASVPNSTKTKIRRAISK